MVQLHDYEFVAYLWKSLSNASIITTLKNSKKNTLQFWVVTESQEKELCLHSAVLHLHSLQGSWRLEFQQGTDGDVDNNLQGSYKGK